MIFPRRFADKVAVVTGAAQGIGRTVALRIAQEGANVALVDRSSLVDEVVGEAEASGAAAIAINADLETFAGATAAIDRTRERFGHIDTLVNNVAGTIWARRTLNTRRRGLRRKSAARSSRYCGVAAPCCPR